MSSKPHNEKRHAGEAWRGSKAKQISTCGGNQTNCKTKTTTTGAKYHKTNRRQILKSRIIDWAIDGKLSPDAAQKALEFMQLVSA